MSTTAVAERNQDISTEPANAERLPIGRRFKDFVGQWTLAEYSDPDGEYASLGIYDINYPLGNKLPIVTETPITEVRFSVVRIMDTDEEDEVGEMPAAPLDAEDLAARGLLRFVDETDTAMLQFGIEFCREDGETVLHISRTPKGRYNFVSEAQSEWRLPEEVMEGKLGVVMGELTELSGQLRPATEEAYPPDGEDAPVFPATV